jgi:microcystin-dependent protein
LNWDFPVFAGTETETICMEVFLGQLLLVPYNFAPRNFAFCQGQILPISQNTALFSLLGTNYGGNGTTTFALPDLQGRIPIGQGQGPGLEDYVLGQIDGVESIVLTLPELPSHNHSIKGSPLAATVSQVSGNAPSNTGADLLLYAAGSASMNANLHPQTLQISGVGTPHENRMPVLTLNWVIALQGIFPARN